MIASFLIYVSLLASWNNLRSQYAHDAAASLQVISQAVQNFAAEKQRLPANITAKDGKPLLSWRVELLPYLEQNALYQQFKNDEPWDSPNNRPLVEKIPAVFTPGQASTWASRLDPQRLSRPAGNTCFQGFVGPGTAWQHGKPVSLADIAAKDGLPNTILLIDGGTTVPWTKPEDLAYDPAGPLPPLGGLYVKSHAVVALGDGTIVAVRPDAEQSQLRTFITYDDGQSGERDAVFGGLPKPEEGWFSVVVAWGPFAGGTALAIIFLVVLLRWWMVMADG